MNKKILLMISILAIGSIAYGEDKNIELTPIQKTILEGEKVDHSFTSDQSERYGDYQDISNIPLNEIRKNKAQVIQAQLFNHIGTETGDNGGVNVEGIKGMYSEGYNTVLDYHNTIKRDDIIGDSVMANYRDSHDMLWLKARQVERYTVERNREYSKHRGEKGWGGNNGVPRILHVDVYGSRVANYRGEQITEHRTFVLDSDPHGGHNIHEDDYGRGAGQIQIEHKNVSLGTENVEFASSGMTPEKGGFERYEGIDTGNGHGTFDMKLVDHEVFSDGRLSTRAAFTGFSGFVSENAKVDRNTGKSYIQDGLPGGLDENYEPVGHFVNLMSPAANVDGISGTVNPTGRFAYVDNIGSKATKPQVLQKIIINGKSFSRFEIITGHPVKQVFGFQYTDPTDSTKFLPFKIYDDKGKEVEILDTPKYYDATKKGYTFYLDNTQFPGVESAGVYAFTLQPSGDQELLKSSLVIDRKIDPNEESKNPYSDTNKGSHRLGDDMSSKTDLFETPGELQDALLAGPFKQKQAIINYQNINLDGKDKIGLDDPKAVIEYDKKEFLNNNNIAYVSNRGWVEAHNGATAVKLDTTKNFVNEGVIIADKASKAIVMNDNDNILQFRNDLITGSIDLKGGDDTLLLTNPLHTMDQFGLDKITHKDFGKARDFAMSELMEMKDSFLESRLTYGNWIVTKALTAKEGVVGSDFEDIWNRILSGDIEISAYVDSMPLGSYSDDAISDVNKVREKIDEIRGYENQAKIAIAPYIINGVDIEHVNQIHAQSGDWVFNNSNISIDPTSMTKAKNFDWIVASEKASDLTEGYDYESQKGNIEFNSDVTFNFDENKNTGKIFANKISFNDGILLKTSDSKNHDGLSLGSAFNSKDGVIIKDQSKIKYNGHKTRVMVGDRELSGSLVTPHTNMEIFDVISEGEEAAKVEAMKQEAIKQEEVAIAKAEKEETERLKQIEEKLIAEKAEKDLAKKQEELKEVAQEEKELEVEVVDKIISQEQKEKDIAKSPKEQENIQKEIVKEKEMERKILLANQLEQENIQEGNEIIAQGNVEKVEKKLEKSGKVLDQLVKEGVIIHKNRSYEVMTEGSIITDGQPIVINGPRVLKDGNAMDVAISVPKAKEITLNTEIIVTDESSKAVEMNNKDNKLTIKKNVTGIIDFGSGDDTLTLDSSSKDTKNINSQIVGLTKLEVTEGDWHLEAPNDGEITIGAGSLNDSDSVNNQNEVSDESEMVSRLTFDSPVTIEINPLTNKRGHIEADNITFNSSLRLKSVGLIPSKKMDKKLEVVKSNHKIIIDKNDILMDSVTPLYKITGEMNNQGTSIYAHVVVNEDVFEKRNKITDKSLSKNANLIHDISKNEREQMNYSIAENTSGYASYKTKAYRGSSYSDLKLSEQVVEVGMNEKGTKNMYNYRIGYYSGSGGDNNGSLSAKGLTGDISGKYYSANANLWVSADLGLGFIAQKDINRYDKFKMLDYNSGHENDLYLSTTSLVGYDINVYESQRRDTLKVTPYMGLGLGYESLGKYIEKGTDSLTLDSSKKATSTFITGISSKYIYHITDTQSLGFKLFGEMDADLIQSNDRLGKYSESGIRVSSSAVKYTIPVVLGGEVIYSPMTNLDINLSYKHNSGKLYNYTTSLGLGYKF